MAEVVIERGVAAGDDMGARTNPDFRFIPYWHFGSDLVLDLVLGFVSDLVSDPRIIAPFRTPVSYTVSYSYHTQ